MLTASSRPRPELIRHASLTDGFDIREPSRPVGLTAGFDSMRVKPRVGRSNSLVLEEPIDFSSMSGRASEREDRRGLGGARRGEGGSASAAALPGVSRRLSEGGSLPVGRFSLGARRPLDDDVSPPSRLLSPLDGSSASPSLAAGGRSRRMSMPNVRFEPAEESSPAVERPRPITPSGSSWRLLPLAMPGMPVSVPNTVKPVHLEDVAESSSPGGPAQRRRRMSMPQVLMERGSRKPEKGGMSATPSWEDDRERPSQDGSIAGAGRVRLGAGSVGASGVPRMRRSQSFSVEVMAGGGTPVAGPRVGPVLAFAAGAAARAARLGTDLGILSQALTSCEQVPSFREEEPTGGSKQEGLSGDNPQEAAEEDESKASDSEEASEAPAGPPVPPKEFRQLAENEKIYDLYEWDEVLQERGDGGKVVICRPKGERAPDCPEADSYVLKFRSKESLQKDGYEDSFRKSTHRLLNLPAHVGVLPVHEVLEDEKFYYVVMARAEGGSLLPALLSEFGDGVMPDSALRKLMKDILEAVAHVHSSGMLHRDIKPDNLVMRVLDDPANPEAKVNKVALIDFDHADPDWDPNVLLDPDRPPADFCGTVWFAAPETFLGHYSQASDLYSVGVILYLLLAGHMPYPDDVFNEEMRRRTQNSRYDWTQGIYNNLREAQISWRSAHWTEQPLCGELCRRLLAFEACDRPVCAEEALSHAWFKSG